jgi:hypothetical protein
LALAKSTPLTFSPLWPVVPRRPKTNGTLNLPPPSSTMLMV